MSSSSTTMLNMRFGTRLFRLPMTSFRLPSERKDPFTKATAIFIYNLALGRKSFSGEHPEIIIYNLRRQRITLSLTTTAHKYIQSVRVLYDAIALGPVHAPPQDWPKQKKTQLNVSRVHSEWFFRGAFLARRPSPGSGGGEGNSPLPNRARNARSTSPSERPSALARARAAFTSSLVARVVSIISLR